MIEPNYLYSELLFLFMAEMLYDKNHLKQNTLTESEFIA